MEVTRALKDVRSRAEERARQKAAGMLPEDSGQQGGGFLSERARAKEALRLEVNTFTGENVRKIAAASQGGQDLQMKLLSTFRFCRMSMRSIS